ncbi:MAG: glyoxylate carboligase [Spirochaetaceae bacterium]|jgi:tartronate-semialdehyde synthase|nr:glyoxylate carboligase [Spirochaetaceae bacterium]
MTAGEAIVHILVKEGITHAFGIPGAGINGFYKYLKDAPITHYLMRHEEAAVHAAGAYCRASGRMALAVATSGPGATNFVTGIYTAWIDSVPLIALTGQAAAALLGKGAFQCADIAEIVKPVVKKAWCVTDAAAVPQVFCDAFKTARSGRPGPVLIDLPLDVQLADIPFEPASYEAGTIEKPLEPDMAGISAALDLLEEAEHPVIIMGGGVILGGAENYLREFAEYTGIPVLTTYMAKGGIPERHPLYAGQIGIQCGAASTGNSVFLAADAVLAVGCRFTDRHTGNTAVYQGQRRFIHVDIDRNELGKIIKPEIPIHADAALALKALTAAAKARGHALKKHGTLPAVPFHETRRAYRPEPDKNRKIIDPREVFAIINRVFDDETIFTTGCGLTQIWSGQYQIINKPRTYLPSGGAGTLGFDIPAAIGASVATGRKAVAVMGDFGFTFLAEELAVASRWNLPVAVIIINNACLSLIRQNQKYAYDYEYAVSVKENNGFIDYIKAARAFGCDAKRAHTYEEAEAALVWAAASKAPVVVEIMADPETDCDMGGDLAHIRRFAGSPAR